MKYKHIILFFGLSLLFYFLTEFLMDYFFEDKTPKWKLLSVSAITAFGLVYPVVKEIKDFRLNKIFARQCIKVALNEKILNLNGFVDILVEKLRIEKFKIVDIQKDPFGIRLSNNFSWKTFGVNYSIILKQGSDGIHFFEISSKPKYRIASIDSGFAYLKLELIEKIILKIIEKQ